MDRRPSAGRVHHRVGYGYDMRKQRCGGFTALDADDRQPLEKLVAAHKRPARTQLRARIVLRNADGIGTQPVADELGVHRLTVRKWRTHYLEHGIDDPLQDRPRLGQPGPISAGRYLVIQTFPVRRPAPDPLAHWTVRAAAARLNVSPSTVHRVWRRHKIRPPSLLPRATSPQCSKARNPAGSIARQSDRPHAERVADPSHRRAGRPAREDPRRVAVHSQR